MLKGAGFLGTWKGASGIHLKKTPGALVVVERPAAEQIAFCQVPEATQIQ